MKEKYLVILEVSQKQAYIFQYKKLVDNISASSLIATETIEDAIKACQMSLRLD